MPLLILLCLLCQMHLIAQGNAELPRLEISENQRFLVTTNGDPFFWLADTAWELLHRCDREEMQQYIAKRKAQGFNVIQTVALAELDGLNTPNPYGELPLVDGDPTRPNPAYFDHVDYFFDLAAEQEMYVALLPTWGDKLFKAGWGVGPEVFNPTNARIFGEWIGRRYAKRTNLVWVVGGDRNPRENTEDVAVWNAFAAGIETGVGGSKNALMTFHPQPTDAGGSSTWFHKENWLDFNFHQTGHCPNHATYEKIALDYSLSPVKPTIDGEPLYEDHPNCFNAKELGYSIARDIRRIMYQNVFYGAAGQTYGCHDVWQMYKLDKDPINGPPRPWPEALDLPMANQVVHLKKLMLSRPYLDRIPAPEMVLRNATDHEYHAAATRDRAGTYALFYFPRGGQHTLDLSPLRTTRLQSWWYDPRTGATLPTALTDRPGHVIVTAPSAGLDNDWVLIVDHGGAGYPLP